MLDRSGRLKIADFGLARAAPPPAGKTFSATAPSQSYRAPELLFGAREYNGPAVDMWAAGCVLAELLGAQIVSLTVSLTVICAETAEQLHVTPVIESRFAAFDMQRFCGLHLHKRMHVCASVKWRCNCANLRRCLQWTLSL
jgi:serine/threonine protein kinase